MPPEDGYTREGTSTNLAKAFLTKQNKTKHTHVHAHAHAHAPAHFLDRALFCEGGCKQGRFGEVCLFFSYRL